MAARHQPSVFMKCFSYRLDQLVLVLFIYNTDKNTLAHHFEMKLCGVETRIPDFKNRTAEYITDRVKKLQQHRILNVLHQKSLSKSGDVEFGS